MDITLKFKLFFSLPFVFGGTMFLTIAYREWRSNYRIIREGVKTEGMVIETYRRPKRTGETRPSTAEAPVVRFVTEQGKTCTYYSTLFTTPCGYQPGQQVDIWYMPEKPELATLSGKDAWVLPIVFGIFGTAMCLIFYPMLFGALWRVMKFGQ